MNKTLSDTITWLRFPLACSIVYLHYYTSDISAEIISEKFHRSFDLYYYIANSISLFPQVAVPIFFFISGYLYFVKFDLHNNTFTFKNWKRNSSKRIQSLLIPYLIWNAIVLCLYALTQYFLNNSTEIQKEGYKLIADYNLIDYFKAFYAIDSTNFPINGPLWFIRDLFLVSTLLTPFIYLAVKHLRFYFILVLGSLYFFNINFPIQGFSSSCIFFFSWGAYMGIKKKTLLTDSNYKFAISLMAIIILSSILYIENFFLHTHLFEITQLLYIISIIFCAFGIIGYLLRKNIIKCNSILAGSSFFIFAIHKPIQVIIRRIIFSIYNPSNEFILIFLNITIPMVVIIISFFLYKLTKKIKILNILNRNR